MKVFALVQHTDQEKADNNQAIMVRVRVGRVLLGCIQSQLLGIADILAKGERHSVQEAGGRDFRRKGQPLKKLRGGTSRQTSSPYLRVPLFLGPSGQLAPHH